MEPRLYPGGILMRTAHLRFACFHTGIYVFRFLSRFTPSELYMLRNKYYQYIYTFFITILSLNHVTYTRMTQ